jgi:glycosyltransferase involved in cell wall biosynthesis
VSSQPRRLPRSAQHGVGAQHVLYITYDGILEPIAYSQVVLYLKNLAPGREIFLVSFEKPAEWADVQRRLDMRAELAEVGIKWVALRYHKAPSLLATTYDMFQGMVVTSYLVLRHRINIVHSRSYIPSVLALGLKRAFRTRFIFDMRGFWADERVEGGLWSRDSTAYRLAKWFERRFLLAADSVVSLTASGIREMQRFDYLRNHPVDFHLIPTCVDLERFRPSKGRAAGGFTLGYAGAAGLWYMMDPAAECFRVLLGMRSDARILILNRGEHGTIRACLQRHGIPDERVELMAVNALDMPRFITRMDAAVFFIKPVFSKKASAPTKLGELLAAGIPCLTNKGVGDMDEILIRDQVGIVVERLDTDSVRKGLEGLLQLTNTPDIQRRCRDTAARYFSLDSGVRAYSQIYDSLCAGSEAASPTG